MSTQTTQNILSIVNEWESAYKSDFIEEMLETLPEEQQRHILNCLQYNTPLKGDAR